jgi:hypothetical protein
MKLRRMRSTQLSVSAWNTALIRWWRVGERALPLAWRMRKTQGAIGFHEQREALAKVAALLPEGVRPTLMGDRFYGSPALIEWCRDKGWGWRLRCKQDLLVFENGGETTLAECFARGEHMLKDIELTEKRVRTHVAMLHEEGHPEPWIIAMSDLPTTWRAGDYGLRWGIEAMFSDFKTRGFNLEDSHIERTDRLDRLVLVLSLALYWAVSTGMWEYKARRGLISENEWLKIKDLAPARGGGAPGSAPGPTTIIAPAATAPHQTGDPSTSSYQAEYRARKQYM